ncbi:TPA: phage tail protein [Morganella morganii]|uniref:phage tail protein n=1 Tax=Morganella morganii TaxID=582 RepID=UPI0034D5F86E
METFTWKVKPGMNIESEPRVRSVRFGDGYEQRRSDGLNSLLNKYSITLSPKNADAQIIRAFLEKHAGVTAFFWKPPHQMHVITVLCRKWSFSVGALRTEITAEFEEVLS